MLEADVGKVVKAAAAAAAAAAMLPDNSTDD